VSRRFYTPSTSTNSTLATATAFTRPALWPASWSFQSTFQLAAQPAAAEVAPFNAAPVAPPQVACAVRNVGSFGVPGDTAKTDALELKPGAGGRAQGRGGYNVPALYGLQVAAPLLHHGQAASLTELLTDPKWADHTRAGNANFLLDSDAATPGKRTDLVQYLWSIDGATAEKAVVTGFDTGCAP
jgi:hypothetical protein